MAFKNFTKLNFMLYNLGIANFAYLIVKFIC